MKGILKNPWFIAFVILGGVVAYFLYSDRPKAGTSTTTTTNPSLVSTETT